MKTLKKVQFHKNIEEELNSGANLGIHIQSHDSLYKTLSELIPYKPSSKVILYEACYDTNKSTEYIASLLNESLEYFPNFILSLKDPEISFAVQSILANSGKKLGIATNMDESIDGDYLLNQRKIIGYSKEYLIKLLKERKKIILDFETLRMNSELGNIIRLLQRTNNTDNLIITSYSPRLVRTLFK